MLLSLPRCHLYPLDIPQRFVSTRKISLLQLLYLYDAEISFTWSFTACFYTLQPVYNLYISNSLYHLFINHNIINHNQLSSYE